MFNLTKLTDWKRRSILKSGKIKRLENKIKNIEKSRDNWKSKAVSFKQDIDELNEELKKNDW